MKNIFEGLSAEALFVSYLALGELTEWGLPCALELYNAAKAELLARGAWDDDAQLAHYDTAMEAFLEAVVPNGQCCAAPLYFEAQPFLNLDGGTYRIDPSEQAAYLERIRFGGYVSRMVWAHCVETGQRVVVTLREHDHMLGMAGLRPGRIKNRL